MQKIVGVSEYMVMNAFFFEKGVRYIFIFEREIVNETKWTCILQ